MDLEVETIKGVTLIHASGRITMHDMPRQLKDKVAALVQDGEKNIVLSLHDLTIIDSSCIGELVACCLSVVRAGGTLKLANPPRRLQELLLVTRMGEIFESYETDTAAIASFAKSSSSG